MEEQQTDYDFSEYMDARLSPEQMENSSNLVEDEELEREAVDLIEECSHYYDKLANFRDERRVARDYYIGDQWNEIIKDPDTGELITEGQHIMNQGKVPVKQNQIRQVVKNLIGQFRDNDNTSVVISRKRESAKAGQMLTNSLQYSLQANSVKELDVRQFEELLISGYFGWKASYGHIDERNIDDVVIDPPHAERIFFNTGITDIRLKQIHTIGEALDVDMGDIISGFAENEADEERIKGYYGQSENSRRDSMMATEQDTSAVDNIDFHMTADNSKHRVFEIWQQKTEKVMIAHDILSADQYETDETAEEIDAENEKRINAALQAGVPEENLGKLIIDYEQRYQKIWYFWFLTPNGKILKHGKTPYDHEQHPYTLGLYPLIDGKIFGLVHDILDQQRNINRQMTLLDFMIGSSAKGVLLFPEDMMPDGWDMDDVADEWVRYNGVIAYKPSKNHTQMPRQIVSNSQNAGAMDQLQMQMGLLEKISGVTDASQGHSPNSGTPSSLYAQQTHNASLANRDFFEFFFSVKKKRDHKIVKLIQQFYDDERYIAIGGKDYEEDSAYYDQEIAKDADFEMVMGQNSNSTVYRQILDEYLMKFLETQQITFDEFLENTSMPFADKLKEARASKMEKMQEMEANGEQSNPEAMNMFNQMAS